MFAGAVDWPGWRRRDKGEESALETLLHYARRYSKAVEAAAPTGPIDVVGRVATRSGMADFGAPGAPGPWDNETFSTGELGRHFGLLQASWAYLGGVAAVLPVELRKGPRGGGREAMLKHVQEAERAYAPKVGCRVPLRTPCDEQRTMILAGLRAAPAALLIFPPAETAASYPGFQFR